MGKKNEPNVRKRGKKGKEKGLREEKAEREEVMGFQSNGAGSPVRKKQTFQLKSRNVFFWVVFKSLMYGCMAFICLSALFCFFFLL
jgi:hypothetical protein